MKYLATRTKIGSVAATAIKNSRMIRLTHKVSISSVIGTHSQVLLKIIMLDIGQKAYTIKKRKEKCQTYRRQIIFCTRLCIFCMYLNFSSVIGNIFSKAQNVPSIFKKAESKLGSKFPASVYFHQFEVFHTSHKL